MSTQFYRGTRKSNGGESLLHDTDFPLDLLEELNAASPLSEGDWVVDKLDYQGKVIERDIDWAKLRIETTAGRVFGAPTGS